MDISCRGTTLYKCGNGPQSQDPFDKHPPEEQGRQMLGAASRSGLWNLRTQRSPQRQPTTQSPIQEPGTPARGREHCRQMSPGAPSNILCLCLKDS